jgi:hypothetical protein
MIKRSINGTCKGLLEVIEDHDDASFPYKADFLHSSARAFFRGGKGWEWLMKLSTPKFNASDLVCKSMIGLIKLLPVEDCATLELIVWTLTDRFMSSVRRMEQNSAIDLTFELDHVNEIHATQSLGLKMHLSNLWVASHDLFREYGHNTIFALAIEEGLDASVISMLREDPAIIKRKQGRPYLDYVLRPTNRRQEDLFNNLPILRELLERGVNPNESYVSGTVWVLFLSASYNASRGNIGVHKIRSNQCDAIELLPKYGADPNVNQVSYMSDRETIRIFTNISGIFEAIIPSERLPSLEKLVRSMRGEG